MDGSTWKKFQFIFIALNVVSPSMAASELKPPCDSEIYCHGTLLEKVQLADLFSDSKQFVDMPLVNSPEQTLENFNTLLKQTYNDPTKDQIQAFVKDNFLEPGTEFVPWDPVDFNPDPEFLNKVKDTELQKWGKELVQLWKVLGRQISDEVCENPDRHSLICLPNPVIVPGGRYREIYYWDSFWTIEGLLLSEMRDTAKGMLENFVQLVREYDLVPNGGRVYYTRRSQPPYLLSMVKVYYDYTQDLEFIRDNINALEQEFQFWEENRSTLVKHLQTGKVYKVNQYKVQISGPRPESYREDYNLTSGLQSEEERLNAYVELKSGAESGWDYSSRWFINGDSNQGDLSNLNITSIAPLDLNSLLCRNARLLAYFYNLTQNYEKAAQYDAIANSKSWAIAELFWNDEDGIWYDLNVHTLEHRRYFYMSNTHPIWSGCFGLEGDRTETVEKVVAYLQREKVLDFVGGIPASLTTTGEKWDFPIAWAPLHHLLITGLQKASFLSPLTEPLAYQIAEKWVRSNYVGYQQTGSMFDKYDATVVGVAGNAGEAAAQVGFGWTNSVVLKLLETFGDRLTASSGNSTSSTGGYA